jgi:transcriptional regulator with XRE-family HTH domain
MERIDDDGLYLYVGVELRKARKVFGATQREVADAVGLPQNSISNIENGKQSVTLSQLYAICAYLNSDPHEILPPKSQVTTNPKKHKVPIGGDIVEITLKEAEESVRKLGRLLGKRRKKES